MSASRVLAAILDHELIAVKRLCGDETWIGPVAETTMTEVNGLNRRLGILLDEIAAHERRSGDIAHP